MTAVSNSPRWVLMNAYFTRLPCDLHRLPMGPPLVLTTTSKVYVKAWEVQAYSNQLVMFLPPFPYLWSIARDVHCRYPSDARH